MRPQRLPDGPVLRGHNATVELLMKDIVPEAIAQQWPVANHLDGWPPGSGATVTGIHALLYLVNHQFWRNDGQPGNDYNRQACR